MSDDRETRTSPIGIRITPTLKAALQRAAVDDHRSTAGLIEKIVVEWLTQKGYLTVPKKPKK